MTATWPAVSAPEAPSSPIPFADCWISEEARDAAQRVLASGWVTTGAECQLFEADVASYVGAEHAVAVSSCTAAIELSLRSLRLAPGAPVLTSTMTFCGAVHAIEHAGLRPVLVDVDPETGMPDETTVARAAAGCSPRPAAMVLVHWAGDPFDRAALAAAAGLPESRVVEDAAHALGTEHAGARVGDGPAVCFSFYATKNLPVGEGGMVTTDDPERAAWMRSARLHGMSQDAWRRYLPGGGWRYDVQESGLKANLTDLQAAIGRAQLQHLPQWQATRARIAARYDAHLVDLPEVRRPHRPRVLEGVHAWHLYAVQLADAQRRDQVATALAQQGIGTSVHFIPVHHMTHFAGLAPAGGLPGADAMFDRLLSLPLYPRLSAGQVDRVAAVLREALEGANR